jgi:hypothetical protein
MVKPKIKNESLSLSRQMVIREQVFRFKQKKFERHLIKDYEIYTSKKKEKVENN